MARRSVSAIKRISNYRRSREHLHEVVKQAAQSIAELEFFPSTEHLVALFDYDETLDAVYVLDRLGIQRSHTIRRIDVDNPELAQAQDSALAGRSLFRPAPTGCDQSLKEYFIMLQAGLTHYLTAPYISTATGKFCVTGSESIEQKSGDRLIICCDFISSGPKLTS